MSREQLGPGWKKWIPAHGEECSRACHEDVSTPMLGPALRVELKKSLLAEFLKIGQQAFLENVAECVSPALPPRGRTDSNVLFQLSSAYTIQRKHYQGKLRLTSKNTSTDPRPCETDKTDILHTLGRAELRWKTTGE